jgi:hypothetical protein
MIQEDNSVFLLDHRRRILRLTGRQPVRISEAIENDISTYNRVDDCFSTSFQWEGSIHVLFGFPSAGKGWSIDLKNDQWSEWRGYNNGWARVRLNALVYVPSLQTVYAGDFETGKVWSFSDTETTDAGGLMRCQRTFSHRDLGTSQRKRANLFRVNVDRGIASAHSGTTSQTNPQVELRWKDDDKDWSDHRSVSLGNIGENKHYATFRRLGIYRDRQYQLRISDPGRLKMTSAETDEDPMVS